MKTGRIFKASLWLAFIMSLAFSGCGIKTESPDPAKAYVQSLYGENRELASYDGDDPSVQVSNGTFKRIITVDPSGGPGAEDAEWPLYQTDSRSTMIFDTRSRVENDPLKEQREILTPLIEKYAFSANYASLSLDVPATYRYATLLIWLSLSIFAWIILRIW